VVAFAAFYERGFGVPSHRFLRSLLQYYGMELHHLTPSGILHIMTFVALCEAYMGIDPHFSQWNHLFRSRLPQGSDTEAIVLGGVFINDKSGHDVDPYFDLPKPKSTNGW
jgi:hypothetical protein